MYKILYIYHIFSQISIKRSQKLPYFCLKNVSYETCPIFLMFHVKQGFWINLLQRDQKYTSWWTIYL